MKRSYKIILHVCYWLYSLDLLSLIQMGIQGSNISCERIFGPFTLSYLIIGLTVFYGNYLVILPRFFKTKRFAKLWLAWGGLLLGGILLRYLVEEVFFLKAFGIHNYKTGTTLSYYIYDNLYFIGIYIVMSTVFWMADFWIRSEQEKNKLQKEKFDAEMSMLKNQVNPHFLFNTLNNIYSLAYKKSDRAPESILKLSNLMRYMLKDCSAEKVLLGQELEYIRDFIELQRLRYSNAGIVELDIATDSSAYLIAPLLLIPFIENGFKHGDLTNEAYPLQVSISAVNGRLDLQVQNAKATANKDDSSGIGLENVKKRLELLYPGNYTLKISETEAAYICQLTINL